MILSKRISVLTAILAVCSGCSSSAFNQGLTFQDRGDYIQAYRCFSDLSSRHPSNSKYYTYMENSRRLAFDQSIGMAQQAFAEENLDDFVKYMKQANEIRPHRGARMAVKVVENGRDNGDSDSKIMRRLKSEMELYGSDGTLADALEQTVIKIGNLVRQGQMKDPVLVSDIVCGEGNKRNSASVYFENELTTALVGVGVRVVDRDNIEAIKEEMRVGSGTMADESGAVEMGKIAGARAIITGSFFKWERGYKYQLKVTDVETSKVIVQDSSVFSGGKAFDDMVRK